MALPFAPGQTILHRIPFIDDAGRFPPAITDVKPMVVVEDTPELVSLYLPAGTPTILAVPLQPGQPRPWLQGEWKLVRSSWDRWNTLFLMVPGDWHAIWVMWTPEFEFLGWYVNLQEPLDRTRIGFDSRDLWLDIVVAPGCSWRWKDEDEVERVVERGVLQRATADRARAEGLSVIQRIEARAWPFVDDWLDWRPDPVWPAPTLPQDDVLVLDP